MNGKQILIIPIFIFLLVIVNGETDLYIINTFNNSLESENISLIAQHNETRYLNISFNSVVLNYSLNLNGYPGIEFPENSQSQTFSLFHQEGIGGRNDISFQGSNLSLLYAEDFCSGNSSIPNLVWIARYNRSLKLFQAFLCPTGYGINFKINQEEGYRFFINESQNWTYFSVAYNNISIQHLITGLNLVSISQYANITSAQQLIENIGGELVSFVQILNSTNYSYIRYYSDGSGINFNISPDVPVHINITQDFNWTYTSKYYPSNFSITIPNETLFTYQNNLSSIISTQFNYSLIQNYLDHYCMLDNEKYCQIPHYFCSYTSGLLSYDSLKLFLLKKLKLSGLKTLYANDSRTVFYFNATNNYFELNNTNWEFIPEERVNSTSSQPMHLSPNETIFVYIDHLFTTNQTHNVNVSAYDNNLIDEKNITVIT
ncbi:MAG: hypothetical protein V1735_04035 [Nanoarchaeota archaeon]